jgi:hypothetical protein
MGVRPIRGARDIGVLLDVLLGYAAQNHENGLNWNRRSEEKVPQVALPAPEADLLGFEVDSVAEASALPLQGPTASGAGDDPIGMARNDRLRMTSDAF